MTAGRAGFLESRRRAHAASSSPPETPLASRAGGNAVTRLNTLSSAFQEPELPGLGDGLAAGGGAQFPVDRLHLRPDGVV